MVKKALIFCILTVFAFFCCSCGGIALSSSEVNSFNLEEGPEDLAKLGRALNGTEGIKVSLSAPEAAYILDSLASLGTVQTEGFSLEMELNGSGDWTQLSALSSIAGLGTLIINGINDMTSVEPISSLAGLRELQIYNGKVKDLSPLLNTTSLEKLHLELEEYDFSTLLQLPVSEIEIPVNDKIWVALDLLKNNPAVKTINNAGVDTYTSGEKLAEDPKRLYYYNQFKYVYFLNAVLQGVKAGEYTQAEEGAKPVLNDSVMIASPDGVLQDIPYREQKMLRTACGFSENDLEARIYFPYIEPYTESAENPTMIRFGGTARMRDDFLVSVSEDDCGTVVFFYAYEQETVREGNGDTVTVGQPVAQVVDLRNKVVYDPVPLASQDSSLEPALLQTAYLEELNNYISSLTIAR